MADSESDKFIPLLSGKPLREYSAAEFKAYVVSLYFKKQLKKKAPKEVKPFTFRLNKKGTACIRVNRKPKWLSEAEVTQISTESNIPLDLLRKKLQKSKIEIKAGEIEENTVCADIL